MGDEVKSIKGRAFDNNLRKESMDLWKTLRNRVFLFRMFYYEIGYKSVTQSLSVAYQAIFDSAT